MLKWQEILYFYTNQKGDAFTLLKAIILQKVIQTQVKNKSDYYNTMLFLNFTNVIMKKLLNKYQMLTITQEKKIYFLPQELFA